MTVDNRVRAPELRRDFNCREFRLIATCVFTRRQTALALPVFRQRCERSIFQNLESGINVDRRYLRL